MELRIYEQELNFHETFFQSNLAEKNCNFTSFYCFKENQQGIQQSTQALNQTSLVTTELTVLADKINQMVTELQGENKTDDKPKV